MSASPLFIHRPAGAAAPLVFDSPHSGIEYPADFAPAASREHIATTWDAHVDALFRGVTEAGAVLIAATFPRAYLDANRAADDIDPELLDEPWPEPVALSEHARRGMGLIRRYALPGVPMYGRRLSVAEVRRRIDDYHRPYREALHLEIDAAVARHGRVWHFNCHSMKSRGNAMNTDSGRARPDFVIGDRDGTSADPAVTRWVAAHFSDLGYRVQVNDPYRGADIVRAHGDPARGRCSVQIEINRALYMDEATCERGPGFGRLQDHLAGFALAAAERLGSAGVRLFP
jgi:N-formylglutamate deformylase